MIQTKKCYAPPVSLQNFIQKRVIGHCDGQCYGVEVNIPAKKAGKVPMIGQHTLNQKSSLNKRSKNFFTFIFGLNSFIHVALPSTDRKCLWVSINDSDPSNLFLLFPFLLFFDLKIEKMKPFKSHANTR